jgi:hypothetical protein
MGKLNFQDWRVFMSSVKKIKFPMKEIECVDNPAMREMTDDGYREFLHQGGVGGLMYVDHHDVLRSEVADYALATSREQLDILIEYLQSLRSKMSPRRK